MTDSETQERTFKKILALCDVMEQMITEIQAPEVKNKKDLLEIVTPVALRVDEAVKLVTENFIEHVKISEKSDRTRSHAIDMAMKGIYDALYVMKEKGEQLVERLQKEPQNA